MTDILVSCTAFLLLLASSICNCVSCFLFYHLSRHSLFGFLLVLHVHLSPHFLLGFHLIFLVHWCTDFFHSILLLYYHIYYIFSHYLVLYLELLLDIFGLLIILLSLRQHLIFSADLIISYSRPSCNSLFVNI